jgi:twinkle protein
MNMSFVPWPPVFAELNRKTHGRALGTITMFVAGTGVGKSSWLREDAYHLWKTTNAKIGMCFLEEDVGETVSAILSIHTNRRLGLPNSGVTAEQRRAAWEEVMGDDRFMIVDHQGSVSDGSLVDKIEFLVLSGCQYIYLDHITIAVSDSQETDVNRAIDRLMSDLLKLVKRHKHLWLGIVSHLRKVATGEVSFESGGMITEDDLKGSGSLKQISFQTIALSRNKLHEDEEQRHISRIWLLKDRKTGETGPAGAYKFNKASGRIEQVSEFELNKEEFELIE